MESEEAKTHPVEIVERQVHVAYMTCGATYSEEEVGDQKADSAASIVLTQ